MKFDKEQAEKEWQEFVKENEARLNELFVNIKILEPVNTDENKLNITNTCQKATVTYR